MSVARTDITKARAMLARLVLNLTAAANGEIVARAGAAIQAQIAAVTRSKLARHVLTGHALAESTTTRSGTLIQFHAPQYIFFKVLAVFRSGMPPFVLTRAIKILQAELTASLGGQASPLALAEDAAEEAAAEKSRSTFKKETARIWRQSAAGKAAAKAARALAKKAGS